MALSDSWLKANVGKARDKTEEKADRDGLSVRASPKGKLVYQMRYRYAGSPVRLDLGSYPLMGLKAAREECSRLRAQLEAGHDPRVVIAVERQRIQTAATLEDLYRQWHEGACSKLKKNAAVYLRSFELHVFPELGKLPAGQVTLQAWLHLLEALAQTMPSMAERVLVDAKQMYKWAVRRHLVSSNPLADISAAVDLHLRRNQESRSLGDGEIRWVWDAIENSRMLEKNGIFLKLCLVYGCRGGELRIAEKAHVDLGRGVWITPPENHKVGKRTGKPLLRPILAGTEPLFRRALELSPGRYLFTNKGAEKCMGPSALLALPGNLMQWLRRNRGIHMEDWSMHDLRRTARTNFSTLTAPHIAEIMLGHKLPGVWQVYDQHDYLAEQREAYQAWWDRLQALTGS